jgi:hypothetical protein
MNAYGKVLDQNLCALLRLDRIAEMREGDLGATGRAIDVIRHRTRVRVFHVLARDVERLTPGEWWEDCA